MIHTIIVEDDPMVAQINLQYLNRFGGFSVDEIFSNGKDAWDYLQNQQPDLIILDVYMPVISGQQLLRSIRTANMRCSVIMITAATEMVIVDEALRLGIVDYLIKPYTCERFQQAIQTFLKKENLLKGRSNADQAIIDQLLKNESAAVSETELQKGLNHKTLARVKKQLEEASHETSHTCESLSTATGLSKVTVRRYLHYLIELGIVQTEIDYETGGRPRVIYKIK